jgi:hypothetical protein
MLVEAADRDAIEDAAVRPHCEILASTLARCLKLGQYLKLSEISTGKALAGLR